MVALTTPKRRCAIYTRKSHEEGLEQEFNSLDAQRESGETFIASQKHEGWVVLPDLYDDGGWTGANAERPALKQLLVDIEAGKIDMVVVYKIDRLSRSLIDFVNLLQIFERHQVAFVSVTQQFNTATPMGRLVLNILICFAQFERENMGERIRDKMAASRRRGKWVGGIPPLGYDVDFTVKKLVVNETEAATVRWVFERFLQVKSGCTVATEARQRGVTTKAWTSKKGKVHRGQPMDRGAIYKMLHQRNYIGEVTYQDTHYPGEQAAIIPRRLWDQVHEILAANHTVRSNHNRCVVPGFLKGAVHCAHCGSSMTMSYTRKGAGQPMYRYYRCVTGAKQGAEACPLTQVPAGDLEREVLVHLRRILRTPGVLAATSAAAIAAGQTEGVRLDHRGVVEAMQHLDEVWEELFPAEQERIVEQVVARVDVGLDHSDLCLRLDGVASLANELRGMPGVVIAQGAALIRLAVRARRRSGRTRLVAPESTVVREHPSEPDTLTIAIARAFRWQELMESGRVPSVSALAEREEVDEAFIRRQLRLTLHSPRLIEHLVQGGDGMDSIQQAVRQVPADIWS